ncbi:serine hydrolase domain-containing protein [Proteinivorax hydrogeniformans]|uniref:Serine hydrolase domain-containing protein n=1 Tax=Proteinivorax hydrogeniformans TaxID=1826727 RepID=A0AAU8HRW5_9FIRM
MPSLEEGLKSHMPARVFPPGEKIVYSNYGTSLAGYIVERVSGQSFEEYIEGNILSRLGMESSTFSQPLPKSLVANMSEGYNYADGKFHKGSFEFISAPAGGMSSTSHDMAKFMIANLQKGRFENETILQPDTIEKMQSRQFCHHPKLSGFTYGFIDYEINGQRIIGHDGTTMLFHTGMILLPEHNIGMFVSLNGGSYKAKNNIINGFMDRYFPKDMQPIYQLTEGAKQRGKNYVGQYRTTRGSYTTKEKALVVLGDSINIGVDDKGYLTASFHGENYKFYEVEPGFYRNINTEEDQLISSMVFEKESDGDGYFLSTGIATYTSPPWYGTSTFLGLALAT